jgi:hypothetical protein
VVALGAAGTAAAQKPVTVAELIAALEKNASALYVDQTVRGCAPDEVL